MSTQENSASSIINEAAPPEHINSNTVTSLSPLIPLEDCKCPICLDYFIDVVETRCHHRFCNFCLENWLRVSLHRQCPTCRTNVNVGSIQVASHLQDLINATIHPILSDVIIRERRQVRLDRQAQVERFATEREQTQALLARITSTSPRSRRIRRDRRFDAIDDESTSSEAGANFLSRRIINWWDNNNNHATSTTGEQPQRARIVDAEQHGNDVEDLPYGLFRRIPRINHYDQNFERDRMQEPAEPPNWNMAGRSSTVGSQRGHVRGTPTQYNQSYHESLMEEYSYHLRRVNSAHTRIREAYRDFNYHNGRMQEILAEHRSFFSSVRGSSENAAIGPDEDNAVSYEDYEDLIGAEMGELLDNSPAAQVVFGRLASENVLGSNSQNGLRYPMFGRGPGGGSRTSTRASRGSSRRYSQFQNEYESSFSNRTNVIDMEHEIQSRRNQLNRLSSLIRQCPWNSETTTYSRGGLTSPVDSIPNSSVPISTPMQYQYPVSEADLTGMEDIRSANVQHQTMVERLTGGGSGTNTHSPSAANSRRMRRRLARTNIFRPGDFIRTTNNAASSNEMPQTRNSFSDNLLPAIIALGEANVSNTTENHNSRDATFPNIPTDSRTRQGNEILNGNNLANTRRPRNHASIVSIGGINGSSASEEEPTTETRRTFRRRNSRSPVPHTTTSRTISVPPRSRSHATFRRKVRFQQRQHINQDNRSAMGADVTTSLPHNIVSHVQDRDLNNDDNDDQLSNVTTAASDNVNIERNENPENHPTTNVLLNDSGTENDSDVFSSSLRARSSMSNFLKTLCNKFKAR